MSLPLFRTPPLVEEAALRDGGLRLDQLRSLKSSEGCMLLYSIGPDLVDDRAAQNLGVDQRGDIVYPLKDGVRPPASDAP